MNESLGQRIKRLRKSAGMSQAQLAEACGWKSQSRVGNYEVGTREPTLADLAAMAKALRVDQSDILLTAKSADSGALNHDDEPAVTISAADQVKQMLSKVKGLTAAAHDRIVAAAEESSPQVIPGDFQALRPRNEEIVIPQYDVRAAMGHGQVPPDYNETVRNLVVREEVLREKGVTYTSTTSLAMITGWGQSMEGTINDKDLVIVDRGITEFIGEGVYVVTWHQELYIKRIMRLDEENYRLISDNQHYENQTARIEDVTIHAKVLLIWNARKA
jgi:transcriptional regulator with XRE-family HTH domain